MSARGVSTWVTVAAVILLSACTNPISDVPGDSDGADTTPPSADKPAAPGLLLPADGAADTGNLVTLEWEASTGATSYDVYLGTDSPPAVLASGGEEITTTELAVSGLSYDTTYSWFVRAKNAEGSADSEVRSFSTGAAPTSPPDPQTYTVSYDANGADSGTAPPAQTKSEGADLTLSGNTGNLARDGFTFAGWNTADDGSGTSYAEGETYSADADVTLYAEWAEAYAIGDTGPAGGIIFYDDEADGVDDIADARYLEVAPASTEWNDKEWGGRGTDVNGDNSGVAPELDGIGAGEANTQAIVDAFGETEPYDELSDYAAKLAWDLEHGGYDDWFLPSKDELNAIWDNIVDDGSGANSGVGGFSSGSYWSSSEANAIVAWYHYFGSGGIQNSNYKDTEIRVRAVRAF